jgi:two-component system, OmpR family, sensor histidine kinase ArlS
MKIRTRITILFTLITAALLLAFVLVIYYSARADREKEFYHLLKKEAITKANLFLNARVDTRTLQDIYRNNRQILNEVEVAVYDTAFTLLYHDAVNIDFVKETAQMMDKINAGGEISFYQQGWQVVGLRYSFQNKNYIVTAAAYDQYGYNKLNSLLQNSIIAFICAVLVIYIVGIFFSKKAFETVSQMTEKAKIISATNLDLRLATNGSKDELAELAETFNAMLDRLENSFDAQKHFVSNISHELRTPLAAIIAELELATTGEQDVAAYKAAILNALHDTHKLVKLSNSLLDMAKASYDPSEIAFRPVRVDELLLDARQQVQQANAGYHVDIRFAADGAITENENALLVNGNEYLLKVAFANLFENGCKFSDNRTCVVTINTDGSQVLLQFADKGIGIAAAELGKIFTPFYRGINKNYTTGNGIGLSLTKKIITLHKGEVLVRSQPNQGTIFTVSLPVCYHL